MTRSAHESTSRSRSFRLRRRLPVHDEGDVGEECRLAAHGVGPQLASVIVHDVLREILPVQARVQHRKSIAGALPPEEEVEPRDDPMRAAEDEGAPAAVGPLALLRRLAPPLDQPQDVRGVPLAHRLSGRAFELLQRSAAPVLVLEGGVSRQPPLLLPPRQRVVPNASCSPLRVCPRGSGCIRSPSSSRPSRLHSTPLSSSPMASHCKAVGCDPSTPGSKSRALVRASASDAASASVSGPRSRLRCCSATARPSGRREATTQPSSSPSPYPVLPRASSVSS
jgi:hypothetical protein